MGLFNKILNKKQDVQPSMQNNADYGVTIGADVLDTVIDMTK